MNHKRHKKITAKEIFHGLGNAFRTVEKPIERVANKVIHVQEKAIGEVGGVLKASSWPLIIVGGVVLIVFLNKK